MFALPATEQRFTSYQRKLFVFLSVACFFEGYDFFALAQILPNLREDMGLSEGMSGLMNSVIASGTIAAYFLIRKADRWGRRRVLTVTIAGYTLFTFLSGLAPGWIAFMIAQFFARLFLIAEWATSMVYAAEEFPAARRGMVVGVIQAFTALGAIVCAAIVPFLLSTPWGWRTVYLTAIIPLVLVAYARRNLRETDRFVQQGRRDPRPFTLILRTRYRRRVLSMGMIWGLTYLCTNVAVLYWKEFAVHERGLSDQQVGASIAIAAAAAMPLVFYAGRLLDRLGRRRGATVIFGLSMAGLLGAYNLHGQVALTIALVLGIFCANAPMSVLNTLTTELFPTNMRADAFAMANNILGRLGYVLGPWLVGIAAESIGFGAAVSATAVFPLIALALIALALPETSGRELEETAAA